jgi:hypothetical protein
MGKGAILGEVASHAHHIVSYATGRDALEVSAKLTTFVDRRDVYDNSYVMVRFRFTDGARPHLGQLCGGRHVDQRSIGNRGRCASPVQPAKLRWLISRYAAQAALPASVG